MSSGDGDDNSDDGFDFGIRDVSPYGSYWMDESGNTLDSELVLYLKFSEGSGTIAKDSSNRKDDGTLLDANSTNDDGNTPPQWVDGKFGKSLKFDGTDDYVDIPNNPNGNYPRTFSAWIKDVPTNGRYEIINARGTYFNIQNGKVCFYISGANTEYLCSQDSIISNEWNFVVGVYENGVEKVYVNGKLSGILEVGVPNSGTSDDVIGVCRYCGWTSWFSGIIDEIRIYNRALSETEIKALYYAGSTTQYGKFGNSDNNITHIFITSWNYDTKYCDDFKTWQNGKTYRYLGIEDSKTFAQPITPFGTVLHLRFNEGNGTVVYDISGHKNDGMIYNGSTICINNGTHNSDCPKWVNSLNSNFGKALSFDGSNDYVKINDSSTLNPINQLTICAWFMFRHDTAQTYDPIVEKPDGDRIGYGLLINKNSNKLVFYLNTTDSYGSEEGPVINPNVWYFACGVWDGSIASIYLNGSNVYSRLHTGNLDLDSSPLYVGKWNTHYFNGTIDEVLIINRSLSAEEIYQLYIGGYQRIIQKYGINRSHRIISYDGLDHITFNLSAHQKDYSWQNDYDQQQLLIIVNYSKNPEGYATYLINNSQQREAWILLANNKTSKQLLIVTSNRSINSFKSNEDLEIKKLTLKFNGSQMITLGYLESNVASDNDNNMVPDLLENKQSIGFSSNEKLDQIAKQSFAYYNLSYDGYKFLANFYYYLNEFYNPYYILGLKQPTGVENAYYITTRKINSQSWDIFVSQQTSRFHLNATNISATRNLIAYINFKKNNVTIYPRNELAIEGIPSSFSGEGNLEYIRGISLPKAEAKLYLKYNESLSYWVNYILPADADYLIIEVSNPQVFTQLLKYNLSSNDQIYLPNGSITNAYDLNSVCYSNVSYQMICSQASDKEVAIGLVAAYGLINSICYKNDTNYLINLTTPQNRIIVPLTSNCDLVLKKMETIRTYGLPITPFEKIAAGLNYITMTLTYDKIKIIGDLKFSTGYTRICVKNMGKEHGIILVKIYKC